MMCDIENTLTISGWKYEICMCAWTQGLLCIKPVLHFTLKYSVTLEFADKQKYFPGDG